MKRYIFFTLIAVVALITLSGCGAGLDGEETGTVETSLDSAADMDTVSKSITVSAQGTVTTMPDVAYISVGVTTQDTEMQKAQDSNAEVMNTMAEALKGAGLTDDDIRTTQYNAYPIYDYSNDTRKIVKYEVTNQVELTIKDIERVGEYIDIAVNNGANMANSISFGILDEQGEYNEALKLAVEAAKAKADTLAAAGGVKIIGTLQITENTSGGQVYREYGELADTASGSTPISTGDLEIDASVTIVYEIE